MVAPAPPAEVEEFNPYLFIKMLPAYHQVAPVAPHIALPKKKKGCVYEEHIFLHNPVETAALI